MKLFFSILLFCLCGRAFADVLVGTFLYSLSGNEATVTGLIGGLKGMGETIPTSITYKGKTYKVVSIGPRAFQNSVIGGVQIPNSVQRIEKEAFANCTLLSYVRIPDSLIYLGKDVFKGCAKLTKPLYGKCFFAYMPRTYEGNYEIPNGITHIGCDAFNGCTKIDSISIPYGVRIIDDWAFWGCSRMIIDRLPSSLRIIGVSSFRGIKNMSILLPDSITTIKANAFSQSVILTNRGTTTLLELWHAGYKGTEIGSSQLLSPPYIESNATYTSIDATLWNYNYYDSYVATYSYNSLKESQGKMVISTESDTLKKSHIQIKNLIPSYDPGLIIEVKKDNVVYKIKSSIKTKAIDFDIRTSTTASSISAVGDWKADKVVVGDTYIMINDTIANCDSIFVYGLTPQLRCTLQYLILVKWSNLSIPYSVKKTVNLQPLTLKTAQPKVISAGNVIVAADSNLDDEEENVGFEWRRTDWTNDFPSNTGTAVLYEGRMEGYIRNLYTEKLWKVRPYYLSNSGTYYYGDWMGIDPTNTSYFEPTVHTYAKVSVEGNTALVKGYALRGTDGVKVQGFKYWKQVAGARSEVSSASIPTNAKTVEATGQVMTANLTDLDYESEYCYVAFVTTTEGETFYGEQQVFKTGEDLTGIEGVTTDQQATVVAVYDMNGRRIDTPRRGLNILRMSDGTTRKVMR